MDTDRLKSKQRFAEYVSVYDITDPKIDLKVVHTYKVAELCEQIGKSIDLTGTDLEIAWLCGLLHDIGRFEQVRRFHTFVDADSIDHALLSTQILWGPDGNIREFVSEEAFDEYLYPAILNHSAYRLPADLNERQEMFCNILRDADKVDIFRVNMQTPLEDIYNATSEELYGGVVSPEVMEAVRGHRAVPRAIRKSTVDHVVGHICLFFELVYPASRTIAVEQGYWGQLCNFKSDNSVTREQFGEIRSEIERFMRD